MTTAACKAARPIPYTVYYGTFVHTPSLGCLEILVDTAVAVSGSGAICLVKPGVSRLDAQLLVKHLLSASFVDASANPTSFFVPGFIDTHIHASQYPNVGLGAGLPLLDWLSQYTFPLELTFSALNLAHADAVYSAVISRTLRAGTTTALYFATIDVSSTKLCADRALALGQRAFVGLVCMDHNESYPLYCLTVDRGVQDTLDLVSHIAHANPAGERLSTAIVTPRFAVTCLRELLTALGSISKQHGLPVQTHVSENAAEIDVVRANFPECENYALVYDSCGLLGQRTVLAHAVHLTASERRLLRDRRCSISHCPHSNTFLQSGQAPVSQYLHTDGINVALGTDVSGGYDPSILHAAKECVTVSHHLAMHNNDSSAVVSWPEALYMATQGGATALGLDITVGLFHVGKKFDALLIDLDSAPSNLDVFPHQIPSPDQDDSARLAKIRDLVAKWFFCGDDRNCTRVWVNGRLVVEK